MMKSIIIGGGKIGYNLFKTLTERGYKATLVERDKDTCERIAEEVEADIIWGDGTDLEVLKDAGIESAEIIAATTGADEENLVICQIAKLSYHTKKTIARVNNPKNTKMFKLLGIDNTVCSTEVIANLIEYELDRDRYRVISTLERGSMLLVEIMIDKKIQWCDKMIRELVLPNECVFVSILREDKVIYPRGDSTLLEMDKVIIITNKGVLTNLVDQINKR